MLNSNENKKIIITIHK